MTPFLTSNLPLELLAKGKVRDVYAVDEDRVLLWTSDRISAFDVVMKEAIPHKGIVLTQTSAWWFRQLETVLTHHMISADADEIIAAIPALKDHRDQIWGRTMLCKRTTVFPIECVIRGFISGSAWKEYAESGTMAGEPLPTGLQESEKLAQPLFTPATKAEEGHDENITITQMAEVVGEDTTRELERLTQMIYATGRDKAAEQGIIIADTKFEFGTDKDGQIILIDEVMTPDSSRFWPADQFEIGRSQPSFDKQPLRDYLDGLRADGKWDGEDPAPALPQDIVDETSRRYVDAYKRLTGEDLKLA